MTRPVSGRVDSVRNGTNRLECVFGDRHLPITPSCYKRFFSMAAADVEEIDFKISQDDQDEHSFVTLWNIASATCEGKLEETRALASKLLNFLCKRDCDFVICSSANIEYLDEKFESDNKILYDWKAESEHVDIISQHAEVPGKAFMSFLKTHKFNPVTKYNPRRADRVEWFNERWSIG